MPHRFIYESAQNTCVECRDVAIIDKFIYLLQNKIAEKLQSVSIPLSIYIKVVYIKGCRRKEIQITCIDVCKSNC